MADTNPDILRFTWGGMVRVMNPFDIKPGDLKLCLNYNSDTFFAKTKRGGYLTFLDNPDGATVHNLMPFDRQDNYRFVLRNSGTSLYKYAFTGTSWGTAVRTNFGGTNDQVQTVGDTHVANAQLDATTKKLAEGFKVSGSGSKSVPSLWVLLGHVDAAATPPPYTTGNITLKIETDNAGSPSGTAVTNATATIKPIQVPPEEDNNGDPVPVWIRVDFATAPTLTAGTQYHLTLSAAATLNATNYYFWSGSEFDCYANGIAKYSINSGTTYTALTGEIDFGFVLNETGGSRCGSCILDNKLFLANGVNNTCYTVDGVNFTDISETIDGNVYTAPTMKYLIPWQGRVYGAGSVLARSRVYFSATLDAGGGTSWVNDPLLNGTGGYIDIDPDNNGIITGLDVENNRLIVHKTNGSYKVIPDEFGRPAEVDPFGASTTSNWSISRSEDFDIGFFFSTNGVFQTSGNAPSLLSSGVQDFIESVDVSTSQDVAGYFFGYKYYCTMGTSITAADNLGGDTYTNPVFVYDIRLQEIYLYTTGHPLNCFTSWKHSDGYYRMFCGDSAGNTFVWNDNTADDTVPIDGELETWEDYLGAPHLTKRYEYITLYTNPGCEASALYSLDYQNPVDLGDLSTGSTKVYFGDNGFNQKNMALKVKDISTTIASVFYGYVVRLTGEEVPVQRRGRAK